MRPGTILFSTLAFEKGWCALKGLGLEFLPDFPMSLKLLLFETKGIASNPLDLLAFQQSGLADVLRIWDLSGFCMIEIYITLSCVFLPWPPGFVKEGVSWNSARHLPLARHGLSSSKWKVGAEIEGKEHYMLCDGCLERGFFYLVGVTLGGFPNMTHRLDQ